MTIVTARSPPRGSRFSALAIYRTINRVDPRASPEGGHRGREAAAVWDCLTRHRRSCAQVARHWSLTALREKLVKIGAWLTRHARRLILQMAEVVIPRDLFGQILIRLRPLPPVPA